MCSQSRNRSVRIGLLSCVASTMVLSLSAQAQEADEEIIVSANKRDEKLSEVAMAISVQSGAELEAQKANGLTDYLGNMPNVSLQTFGSPGLAKVVVRGINSVTFNSTTGTYIDDVPFGSSTLFAGGALLTPDLDPSILERVEVLKGPQGTLYGASAPGGVLKFVTKAPDTGAFFASAREEISSVEHGEVGFSLRGSVNAPIAAEKAALRVSAYYRRDPGYLDNSVDGEKDVNRVESQGVNASLLLTPSDRLSIRLTGILQKLHAHGLNGVAVDQAAFFGFIPGEPASIVPIAGKYDTYFTLDEWNKTRTRVVAGTINYEITPSISLVSATSYSVARNEKRADYTADYVDLVPPGDGVQFLYGLDTKKFTQEIRLSSTDEKPLQWLLGAFYTHEDSELTSVFQPVLPNGDFDTSIPVGYGGRTITSYKEYAAFGNLTYYVTPEIDVTVGARYAHNRTTYRSLERGFYGNPTDPENDLVDQAEPSKDHVTSYLANLRWRPSDDLMVYARAASGYRPGGPRSLPIGLTPPPGFTNKFDSETLWNYEIGTRFSLLEGRVNVGAAAYFIDWKNVQGYMSFGAFGAFGNAGDAESKGFEFEIDMRPFAGLNLGLALGYADTELTRSDPSFGGTVGGALPFAPKLTLSASPEYSWDVSDTWQAYVGGNWQYQSSRFTNIEGAPLTVKFDGYSRVDLRAGVRSDKFDITVFVKNVFDKYAGVADNSTLYYAPAAMGIIDPRTIGLSFSQRF